MNRRNPNLRSDSPQEEWVWGNNRGGGGAPLKDQYGSPVANLKGVLHGDVAVDFSPSPKHNNHRQGNNNNREYDSNNGKQGNNYNTDVEPGQIPGLQNHYDNRGRRDHHGDYGDHDDQWNGNNSNHGNNNHGNNNHGNENNGVQQRGRNNNGSPGKQPGQYQKVRGAITNMNSNLDDAERAQKLNKESEYQRLLREQMLADKKKKDEEKAAIEKEKALEYEQWLKSVNKGKPPSKQISPRANRNNSNSSNNGGGFNNSSSNEGLNDNNHSGDRLRNADGYNANQPNGSNYRNDNRNDFNNRNDGRFNGNNSRDMNDCNDGSSTSRHHHANGNNSQDEVNRFNGKFQESSPSRIPRNRNRDEFEDNQEHYPPQDDRRYRQDNRDNNVRNNDDARHNRDGDNDRNSMKHRSDSMQQRADGSWVARREYDELSQLCDKLLNQQHDLASEVKNQAALIENMRLEVNPGPRSQSVRSRKVDNSRAHERRPDTMQQRVHRAHQPPHPPPQKEKVAVKKFDPRQEMKERRAKNTMNGKKVVAFGVSAAAPGDIAAKEQKKVSSTPDPYKKAPKKKTPTEMHLLEAKSPGNGGGVGLAKLLAKSNQSQVRGKAKAGPTVVTYEDNIGGHSSSGYSSPPITAKGAYNLDGGHKNTASNNHYRSPTGSHHHGGGEELSGKSDFVTHDQNYGDKISGDQLDRLLLRAKGVRSDS